MADDVSTTPPSDGAAAPRAIPPDDMTATGKPVPFRGGGFVTRPVGPVGLAVFVGLIAFWEFGSRAGFISQLVLPAPSEAFGAFRQLIETGML